MWNKLFNKLDFLPLFTLCFCWGICLVKLWYIPFIVLYIGCAILVILSLLFFKKETCRWFLLILGIFLGALFLKNSYILPNSHISKLNFYKSETVLLKGVVDDYPQIASRYTSFILSARELTSENKIYRVTGRILVKIFRKEDIAYGQVVLLKGKVLKPFGRINNRISYRDYLRSQKVNSIFMVSRDTSIKYIGFKNLNLFKALAYKIREKTGNVYFKYLPLTQARIFSAILLGERNQISPYLRRLFVQTGTIHILAISGLHVGIVCFVLNLLLKAMGLRINLRFLLLMPCLIFYCVLTGASSPIMRSTIMAIALLVGFFIRREPLALNSLSLAALLILTLNPHQLFDIGFQLSFLSILAMVLFSPKIKNLCNLKFNLCNQNKVFKFFIAAFSVSFSVWFMLLPFILYYFRMVNLIAIIANIIVVPYFTLVIALGLTLLIIGSLLPGIATIFAQPTNLSMIILIKIIQFFDKIPLAYFYL